MSVQMLIDKQSELMCADYASVSIALRACRHVTCITLTVNCPQPRDRRNVGAENVSDQRKQMSLRYVRNYVTRTEIVP